MMMFTTQLMMILGFVFIQKYTAFVINPKVIDYQHTQRYFQTSHNTYYRTSLKSMPEDKTFTTQECTEMQQLILSLSLEPSDQIRRDKLCTLYDKEYSNPDNTIFKRFVLLFDQTLIEMGTVIQECAKNQAINKMKSSQGGNENETMNTSDGSDDYMSLSRSVEERQLWAMVDMMVQSKVLAKQKMNTVNDFQ